MNINEYYLSTIQWDSDSYKDIAADIRLSCVRMKNVDAQMTFLQSAVDRNPYAVFLTVNFFNRGLKLSEQQKQEILDAVDAYFCSCPPDEHMSLTSESILSYSLPLAYAIHADREPIYTAILSRIFDSAPYREWTERHFEILPFELFFFRTFSILMNSTNGFHTSSRLLWILHEMLDRDTFLQFMMSIGNTRVAVEIQIQNNESVYFTQLIKAAVDHSDTPMIYAIQRVYRDLNLLHLRVSQEELIRMVFLYEEKREFHHSFLLAENLLNKKYASTPDAARYLDDLVTYPAADQNPIWRESKNWYLGYALARKIQADVGHAEQYIARFRFSPDSGLVRLYKRRTVEDIVLETIEPLIKAKKRCIIAFLDAIQGINICDTAVLTRPIKFEYRGSTIDNNDLILQLKEIGYTESEIIDIYFRSHLKRVISISALIRKLKLANKENHSVEYKQNDIKPYFRDRCIVAKFDRNTMMFTTGVIRNNGFMISNKWMLNHPLELARMMACDGDPDYHIIIDGYRLNENLATAYPLLRADNSFGIVPELPADIPFDNDLMGTRIIQSSLRSGSVALISVIPRVIERLGPSRVSFSINDLIGMVFGCVGDALFHVRFLLADQLCRMGVIADAGSEAFAERALSYEKADDNPVWKDDNAWYRYYALARRIQEDADHAEEILAAFDPPSKQYKQKPHPIETTEEIITCAVEKLILARSKSILTYLDTIKPVNLCDEAILLRAAHVYYPKAMIPYEETPSILMEIGYSAKEIIDIYMRSHLRSTIGLYELVDQLKICTPENYLPAHKWYDLSEYFSGYCFMAEYNKTHKSFKTAVLQREILQISGSWTSQNTALFERLKKEAVLKNYIVIDGYRPSKNCLTAHPIMDADNRFGVNARFFTNSNTYLHRMDERFSRFIAILKEVEQKGFLSGNTGRKILSCPVTDVRDEKRQTELQVQIMRCLAAIIRNEQAGDKGVESFITVMIDRTMPVANLYRYNQKGKNTALREHDEPAVAEVLRCWQILLDSECSFNNLYTVYFYTMVKHCVPLSSLFEARFPDPEQKKIRLSSVASKVNCGITLRCTVDGFVYPYTYVTPKEIFSDDRESFCHRFDSSDGSEEGMTHKYRITSYLPKEKRFLLRRSYLKK